jgi:hypothetical protein
LSSVENTFECVEKDSGYQEKWEMINALMTLGTSKAYIKGYTWSSLISKGVHGYLISTDKLCSIVE